MSAPRILNPAATTWAAAGLVLAALAVAVWVWIAEWGATEGGLCGVPVARQAALGELPGLRATFPSLPAPPGQRVLATKDEAVAEAARQRVALTRAGWHGRKRGRLPFSTWAGEWWELWSADRDRSPTTLANADGRLRLHLRPWFGDRPIERISPADVRRWQSQLAGRVGYDTVLACRSLLLRIFQFATDEGDRGQPSPQGTPAQT